MNRLSAAKTAATRVCIGGLILAAEGRTGAHEPAFGSLLP